MDGVQIRAFHEAMQHVGAHSGKSGSAGLDNKNSGDLKDLATIIQPDYDYYVPVDIVVPKNELPKRCIMPLSESQLPLNKK